MFKPRRTAREFLKHIGVPPIFSTMSLSGAETFTFSLMIVNYNSQYTVVYYTLIREGHEEGERGVIMYHDVCKHRKIDREILTHIVVPPTFSTISVSGF